MVTARLAGEGLEIEVQRIYDLLGAKTERRLLLKNYEIDVRASFRHGPLQMSVIVECKEYQGDAKVSDIDMRSFVAKLLAARECGQADKGVFVTTSGYSKNAVATAAAHGIQCLTLRDLYDQLVDFEQYTSVVAAEFQKSPLSTIYVEQTASDIEDYDLLTEESPDTYLHRPLTAHVDELLDGNQRRIALLGNFGTGKTSFCLKYRDLLLRRYLEDPSRRIPVFLNLRNFRADLDIHQALCNYLQGFLGIHIDLHIFMELQRMGRFVFLLDGLDEMASKVDRVVITENLRELDRLSATGDNAFIVTCRTHFFQERITDEFLQNYHVTYLKEWDLDDLKEYLTKRCGSGWQARYERIIKWPQLVDLSRTPLLVEMLVSSLSHLSDSEPLNLGLLYEKYTGTWINRESQRRGAVMSSQQRHRFARQLAATLYARGTKAVHYSALYEIAREFSGYGDAAKLDYFDTDVRTCTFITRDSQGNYSFRHRSFQEYFSALAIADEIRAGNAGLLSLREISPEVTAFLEIADLGQAFEALSGWSKRSDHDLLSKNAVSVLIRFKRPVDAEVEQRLGLEPAPAEAISESIALEQFITDNYEAIRKTVAAAAARTSASSFEVDDLTQIVLMRLLGNPERIRENQLGIRNLMGYIYTMAKYAALDRYRVSTRRGGEGLDNESLRVVDPKGLDFVADIEAEELRTIVDEILDSQVLSARAGDVFRRRIIDGASYDDLSEELSLPASTLRSMLYRAMKVVRAELQRRGYRLTETAAKASPPASAAIPAKTGR